ncbi:hypothetical protein IWZ01DRAFT_526298 [Phyllosticta capitalensis]
MSKLSRSTDLRTDDDSAQVRIQANSTSATRPGENILLVVDAHFGGTDTFFQTSEVCLWGFAALRKAAGIKFSTRISVDKMRAEGLQLSSDSVQARSDRIIGFGAQRWWAVAETALVSWWFSAFLRQNSSTPNISIANITMEPFRPPGDSRQSGEPRQNTPPPAVPKPSQPVWDEEAFWAEHQAAARANGFELLRHARNKLADPAEESARRALIKENHRRIAACEARQKAATATQTAADAAAEATRSAAVAAQAAAAAATAQAAAAALERARMKAPAQRAEEQARKPREDLGSQNTKTASVPLVVDTKEASVPLVSKPAEKETPNSYSTKLQAPAPKFPLPAAPVPGQGAMAKAKAQAQAAVAAARAAAARRETPRPLGPFTSMSSPALPPLPVPTPERAEEQAKEPSEALGNDETKKEGESAFAEQACKGEGALGELQCRGLAGQHVFSCFTERGPATTTGLRVFWRAEEEISRS